ncbi:MAG: ferrochelatase [bacterium]
METAVVDTPLLPNDRTVDSGLAMARNAPDRARVGVLLLNMGGPDRIETIKPFLYNLFGDEEIIDLPGGKAGQFLLGRLIVNMRLGEVKENYRRMGGGSPQVHWTTIQMEGLQERLNGQMDDPPRVGMAMRYWHPFADEALRDLGEAGVEHIVSLTLYPHYTRATTGTSEDDLVAARDRLGMDVPISFISHWYDQPRYLDLWAEKVQGALDAMDPDVRERVQLVVSAHGLPRKFIDRGDPYVEHIEATRDGVLERLEVPPPHHLGFQSRTGPVKWIGPGTEDVLTDLASQGHDAVLVWPISFVSDHVETTCEVGMLFRDQAEDAGIEHYHVVPQFNDDPAFQDVLADLVTGRMKNLDGVPTR